MQKTKAFSPSLRGWRKFSCLTRGISGTSTVRPVPMMVLVMSMQKASWINASTPASGRLRKLHGLNVDLHLPGW